MVKMTVYLPAELVSRLDAEAAASGISKAELIRRGVSLILESTRPTSSRALPVFNGGRALTVGQLDDEIYQNVKARAARR